MVTHGLLLGVADAVVIADEQNGVKLVECTRHHQEAAAAS